MKECTKCHIVKPLTDFGIDKQRVDGYRYFCKQCRSSRRKEIYIKKIRKIPCRPKKYTPEELQIRKRQQCQQWAKKNREKRNEYMRLKHINDPDFKIIQNVRNRINRIVKNIAKAGHSIELLGCSIQEYRQYLESLFTEGMTWDNYGNKDGQWSIDHIIPCNSFDMSKPENQKACFHYTNTQPMWHIDNLIKGIKNLEV